MFGHLRHNAVAYLALFVALGGTSYAAITLPRDSVGTKQLRDDAVTGPKIKAHSLTASDFRSLPVGPKGDTGAPGPKGDTGPAGLSTSLVEDDLSGSTGPSLSSVLAIKSWTVTMSSAGRLDVIDPVVEHISFLNTTSQPVSYSVIGLYLDGYPVPHEMVACNCSVPANDSLSVNTPIQLPQFSLQNIAAGPHTLTLAAYAEGDTTNYVTSVNTRMAIFATG